MEQAEANSILAAIHTVGRSVTELEKKFDREVKRLGDEIGDVRRSVHGSSDPPPSGGAPIADLARQGSAASFDVEELRGELMAVRSELARQSSAMGLGARGFAWLRWLVSSAEGRRTVVGLATMAGALYAAFHAAAGPAPAPAPRESPQVQTDAR